MNTQKYKMNNLGLLKEADRSLYQDANGRYKDTVSRSNIDLSKSHMNYNLCPHAQYTPKEIKEYIESITHKTMRKDANWGSTIITLPKDYEGDPRKFFEAAYAGLKEIYNLTDEDMISAFVHVDESSQHLHAYLVPHYRSNDKEGISWNKVLPRSMYQRQHKMLEEYINQQPYFINYPVHLLNGNTLGIGDVNKLSKSDKEAHRKRIAAQEEQLKKIKQEYVQNEIKPLKKQITALQEELNLLQRLYNHLVSWISERLPALKKMITNALYIDTAQQVNKLHISLNNNKIHKAQTIDDDLESKWEKFKEEYFIKEKTL